MNTSDFTSYNYYRSTKAIVMFEFLVLGERWSNTQIHTLWINITVVVDGWS